MKTKEIEYKSNGFAGKVTVSEATVLQGIKRSRLAYEIGKRDMADADLNIAGFVYCSLMAAADEIEINGEKVEPSFEDFIAMPEAFASRWEAATYDLNPHWREGSDEKKAND